MQNEIEKVKKSVENLSGGTAAHIQSVPITETFKGDVVWDGIVHVFDLKGSKKAIRAYGWGMAKGKAVKEQTVAVLGIPPINSAQDAVKAAIVQEYREGKI